MRTIRLSLSLSAGLYREVEEVARQEGRTKNALLREALRRDVNERRWRELLAYGVRRARTLRMTGADAQRAVEEFRRSR